MPRASFSKRVYALLFSEKWNIGLVQQSAANFIHSKKLAQVRWLKQDNAEFSADPFVSIIDDEPVIYYEYLGEYAAKGELYLVKNFDFSRKQKITGLHPADIHYSYPYLVEDNGKLFCVPESSAANEVALYQIQKTNPANFTNKITLLQGSKFVDSSLIHYQGLYWIFTNIKDKPGELLIYYADSISGPYRPHVLNPIKANEKTSRGGGKMFVVDGVLYRPTQNHSRTYGGSIVINKIKTLSPEKYEDEQVFEIHPRRPYNRGLHNISIRENLIVVDGMMRKFKFATIAKKIDIKLKAMLSKPAMSKV